MYSINLHTLIIYIKLSNNPCDTVTDFPIVQFASFGAGVFWANLSQIGGGAIKKGTYRDPDGVYFASS